jgi:hypothetical protein
MDLIPFRVKSEELPFLTESIELQTPLLLSPETPLQRDQ